MSLWFELLETALLTPSPHNVQPWRLKVVADSEALLFIDAARTMPKEDVTGSFIICAMGMFLESFSILAGNRQMRLVVEMAGAASAIAEEMLSTSPRELIPFCRLTLEPCDPAREPFDESLFRSRRTSRLHYKAASLPDAAIEELSNCAEAWNQRFSVVSNQEQISAILDLNTKALFEDLNAPGYHDEIVSWFRYTERQSERHRDGLDARCMNTSPVSYYLVSNFPWILNAPGLGRLMRAVYRRQLGHVPALGVISGPFWDPSASIDSGRFLMRFWLTAAKHGIFIHPFGNLVTNRPIAAKVESETGVANIWLIFRIGYSEIPPKSRRLPIDRILV